VSCIEQTLWALVNIGALHCLKFLLTQSDKIILEEACLTISNITAGNSAQLQVISDLAMLYLVTVSN
jgi:hypothetical protein